MTLTQHVKEIKDTYHIIVDEITDTMANIRYYDQKIKLTLNLKVDLIARTIEIIDFSGQNWVYSNKIRNGCQYIFVFKKDMKSRNYIMSKDFLITISEFFDIEFPFSVSF